MPIGPRRTCIGCRRTAPPEELVRVVWAPGGDMAVGAGLPGRGAWLCRESPRCYDLARRRRAFSRALRRQVESEAVDRLRDKLYPSVPVDRV